MKKILVFGGTTEGRQIAETLSRSGIFCQVQVATEYGEQVMEESRNLCVTKGRLSVEEMKELCSGGFCAVIDATHPFAEIVRKNIRLSCGSVPLFRFDRNVEEKDSASALFFENTEKCIEWLKNTDGKILLTTGSKDLHLYAASPELCERLVVRVLPGLESIKLCSDAGLEGKQIIAMQGPFSVEMNALLLKEQDIRILVTKESGKNGGMEEKLLAAEKCGVTCAVIRKPLLQKDSGTEGEADLSPYAAVCSCYSELFALLEKLTGTEIEKKCSLKITLAGLGPGGKEWMTLGVQKAVSRADYIFGAERVIGAVSANGKKMPFYLARDIVPELEKLQKEYTGSLNIAVLFSGDTGFYSGEAKLYPELKKLENAEITVLPGLSSIQVLAAKIGINWQDAEILSCHGIEEAVWVQQFKNALKECRKIFLLTSGPEDLQKIGKLLLQEPVPQNRSVWSGFNLSYPDEKIEKLTAEECLKVTKKGLYSLFVI